MAIGSQLIRNPLRALAGGLPALPVVRPELALLERRWLLGCGAMPRGLVRWLRDHGAHVDLAATATEAAVRLTDRLYYAVMLDPRLEGGFDLVRRMKTMGDAFGQITPVVVLPLPCDDEYAVLIDPPKRAWLENVRRLPLEEALLYRDLRSL